MNPAYNDNDRKDFLIEMYKQLSSEIDRHIKVIWQIVGVLLSTFAVYALVEKSVITIDIASSILILVCGLSTAIIIESNYWYNRNLVIIANIERQFLHPKDEEDIHYYFLKHRENNSYLDMMLIQICFIFLLLLIVVLYHLFVQVLPFRHLDFSNFDAIKSIPYLVLLLNGFLLFLFHKKRIKNYNKFKTKSPGIEIYNGNLVPSPTISTNPQV